MRLRRSGVGAPACRNTLALLTSQASLSCSRESFRTPDYAVACRGIQIDHRDVESFTSDVLAWWAANHTKFPTWAIAARIAFSLSPNSASCERVFSLLQCVFGVDRVKSLADQVEASIMLRFNSNQRDRVSK